MCLQLFDAAQMLCSPLDKKALKCRTAGGMISYTGQKVKPLKVKQSALKVKPLKVVKKSEGKVSDDCTARYNSSAFVGVCRKTWKWHKKGFEKAFHWLRMPFHVAMEEYQTWLGFLRLLGQKGYSFEYSPQFGWQGSFHVPAFAEAALTCQFGEWPVSFCEMDMFVKGIHDGFGLRETLFHWCDC